MQARTIPPESQLAPGYSARRRIARSKRRCLLLSCMCLAAWLVLHVVPAFSQGHSEGRQVKPPVRAQAPDSPKAQQTESGQNEPVPAEAEQEVLPGDWGPELLYNVLSSPNEDARD